MALAACAAGAADQALLSRIPADTKVVLGVNVAGFSASAAGKSLFSQAQTAQPQLQQMVKAAGFDPLRDVQEVLVASRGDEAANSRMLVLAKGSFDAAKLAAMAGQQGAAAQNYRGVTVFAGKQPSDGWLALLDSSLLAYGDPASMRRAIDGNGAGAGPDAKLRARISQAERNYDFWFATTAPLAEMAGPNAAAGELGAAVMQGELLKAVEQMSGGIKLGTDLVFGIEAVTRSDKDAAALTDVIRFFAGMAQASAQKDPKTAQSLGFLNQLKMSTQGNLAQISLTIPGAELNKVMQQALSTAMRQVAPAKAEASPAKPQAAPAKAKPAPAGGLTIQSSPRDMGTVVVK